MKFAMTVSVLDCTGCGSCANVCPGKKGNKALIMQTPGHSASTAGMYLLMVSRLMRSRKLRKNSKRPLSKAASSNSLCLNSPAPAQAAARLRMRSWLPSCSATECISPTLPAVPPSGAVLRRLPLTLSTKRARVRLGLTPCLRTTLSMVTACIWLRITMRKAAIDKVEELAKITTVRREESCLRKIPGYRERRLTPIRRRLKS